MGGQASWEAWSVCRHLELARLGEWAAGEAAEQGGGSTV